MIDTGVNYNHPALVENIAVNELEIPNNGIDDDDNGYVDDYVGYDFSNADGQPFDDSGHGTHVAGIILNVDQSIHVNPASLVQSKIQIMPLPAMNSSKKSTDGQPLIERVPCCWLVIR